MEDKKRHPKRFFSSVKTFSGLLLGALPLLKFVFNIDTYEDFLQHPRLVFLFPYLLWIAVAISIVFLISYVVSYKIALHSKTPSTGAYLSEYENQKIKSFVNIRKSKERQRVGNLGDSLYNIIKPDVQMLCDRIVNVLDYNFADDFSVCVKIMDVKSNRLSVQEDDIFLHTYARCWKRIAQRSQGDGESIPLKRNTDFLEIFQGNLSSFSCGNLPLYSWIHNKDWTRKLFRFKTRYDTSSSDYLDNYHSTIVVPIRLDCQFVPAPYLPDSRKKYQLLGFLCLDCEHRLSKMTIRKMLPYMEAFADSLYTLFDEVLSSEFEQKLLGIVNDGN